MNQSFIKIKGAKVHNLKNVSVDIPKNKLVVISGVSGSGKSSLAFDTLYAEGQRRYIESLSTYARQFLGVMKKPEAESIEGISPAISIDQRKGMHNPRSTVGTITEIYDYLRLLFGRIGVPHCPKCGKVISSQTSDQIVKQILKLKRGTEILILGPVIKKRKGYFHGTLEEIQKAGFVRVRIDKIIYHIEEALQIELDKNKKHSIDVVVDKMVVYDNIDKIRLVDSIQTGLKLGKGTVIVSKKSKDSIFSEYFACEGCGISLPELEPRIFSFNSPYGACSDCQGLGVRLEVDPKLVIPNANLSIAEGAIFPWAHASHRIGRQGYFYLQLSELAAKKDFSLDDPVKDLPKEIVKLIIHGDETFEGVIPNLKRRYKETDSDYTRQEIGQYMVEKICDSCGGKRLKKEVLSITINGTSIDQVTELSINDAKEFFKNILKTNKLGEKNSKIAVPIIKEIIERLQFLIDVGLDYLTLSRRAETISGGEEQRIRLATQIGSKLSGVLYVLDEPSVGLHARDQEKLIRILKKLRDLGNTVIVVEHDPQTIFASDWVLDVGPGAGKEGGKIIFQGTFSKLIKSKTLTGQYLSGRKKVEVKSNVLEESSKFLIIEGAKEHNLKNINVKIPLCKLVCITGVSGSGKSSLVSDILAKALLKKFYRAKKEPGEHKAILGTEFLNKVTLVDQSPIGRTPRSNPATYTGCFLYIRDIFSKTKESRGKGYGPGHFSFNAKGGRCEACEGQGMKKIEMFFLPDVYIKCEECNGTRYNKEVLKIEYKGRNVSQILEMTVKEAMKFFKDIPGLFEKLKILSDVGLDYIKLGQPAPSLSGGEAQRVKLSTELSKKGEGKTLYILDEPTTGLHPDDIKKLLLVLKRLVEKGNTVLAVEHNLDFIKNADWCIDLGPEGGNSGGYIVAEGTPKEIAKNKKSYTGKYLSK